MTHRTRRRGLTKIIAVTAAVLSATAMLAVIPESAGAASKPKPGGSVTYGLEAETGTGWCPSSAQLAISGIEVGAAIYDTLMVPNSKYQMVPYLAKSVTPNADSTQWTIVLRDGIKFHDGTPLNADAVLQNFTAYRNSPLLGTALQNIANVTVDGPLQLTVTTKVPWPEFPWFLYIDGRFLIVAPAQLASPDCAFDLIGTGPFKLKSRTLNEDLVAVRNPDYWQKDANGTQLPYLDQITFKPVAEASQRVAALQGGQLDLMHTSDGQQVDALNGLSSSVNLLKEQAGHREVRYYLLNSRDAPLNDLNARKAVAMAIDKQQMNQIRNNGVFTVANGPFDSKVMGYEKNPGGPAYNPKQATKLATAYKAAHGGNFDVVLEYTNDPANAAEAQLLQQQLKKVGITANLKQDDQTSFVSTAISGSFSIMLWRQHPGDDPDANYQWWQDGSLLNFGQIKDPTLQSLLDQGRVETDQAKRKQIYEQVNQRFASQVYNVWAYYAQWVIGAKKNVQGLAGPPLPDKGGQPALLLYGREPLLGIWLKQ